MSESAFKGTQWRGGKGHRKYHYTIPEIASAKKVTLHAVRKAIARGVLEPGNLESVTKYLMSQKCRKKN